MALTVQKLREILALGKNSLVMDEQNCSVTSLTKCPNFDNVYNLSIKDGIVMTSKELLSQLTTLKDSDVVQFEDEKDIVHTMVSDYVLLSTQPPIGTCQRCGEYIYPSITEGYQGFCPYHDEDLFINEITPFNNEMWVKYHGLKPNIFI